MRIAVFSTKSYDRQFLEAANARHGHSLQYFEPRLTHETVTLAAGYDAVCVFVNDVLDRIVQERLSEGGVRTIALRCAGFNNVDLTAAQDLGLSVVRVPAYSPYAVAEHTVGMMLALNRRLTRAHNRVREGNFALDGLLGFDMHGKTAGIIGTGKIGEITANILKGFGCTLLAYDPYTNPALAGVAEYVDLATLYARSDIVTLHCPLTPQTHHLINESALAQMKHGAMLINTSRGALVDAAAVVEALKTGQLGYFGMDVYEEEADVFFEDLSDRILQDDLLARLLTLPNVLITGHQAFFTRNALEQISETTLSNLTAIERGETVPNTVTTDRHVNK